MLYLTQAIRLAVCLVALSVASFGETSSKVVAIDTLLRTYHNYGQFNGVALVSDRGKIVYERAFGSANFELRVPNAVDTRFRVGSITKAFTAILVLQLAEKKSIDLDLSAGSYLPQFANTNFSRFTIRQLLTHTSGLPDYNNIPEFFRSVQSGLLSKDEILVRISEFDLLFEPGSKFGYSNDGYRVLGAIIEKVTGKAYERVLREQILDPLRMTDSGYMSRTALIDNRASGYRKTIAGIENAAYYEASPGSGMYSTAHNLLEWQKSLAEGKLLSKTSRDLIWSISPYGNAYGWHVSNAERRGLRLGSEGAVFGFFSRFAFFPASDRTIILFTNVRGRTNYLSDIEEGLSDILAGRRPALPRRSIAETLYATVRKNGVREAIVQYAKLKRTAAQAYNFSEGELNSLGYQFISIGQLTDAIEIFKLNVVAFPSSSNVYDSLGEAYMLSGNKPLAIENYQKSVDLNPQNRNGIEMLRRLKES